MSLQRRSLLKLAAGAAGIAALPRAIRAQSPPHVVVVGGGFGGATVAKYLRHWSRQRIEVTLVERHARHTSCVMSNLVLNDHLRLRDLRLTYDALASRYGVRVVRNYARDIDPIAQRLRVDHGEWIEYDRLVVSGGINFVKPPGWDPAAMPHAWVAGGQTVKLRNQLHAVPSGGHIIMTIPPSPYRCPPGPYERACLLADFLKRRDGGGTVTVLDANPSIQAESATFIRAFNDLYGSIVNYVPDAQLQSVDSATNSVTTNKGRFHADLVNVIPTHRASWIVRRSGLAGSGDWAPVDPLTYESTLSDFANVHVIGDSQATGQPKSGHMANAQGKVCADAIIRLFDGESPFTMERMESVVTASACYSPITYDEASYLSAVFAYDPVLRKMAVTHIGEAEHWDKENFKDMFGWSRNLFADSFG